MDTDHHIRVVTAVADTISAGAIVGSILGWFPPIAAFAATIWYAVQIWESHTVQKWWRLHRRKRKTYARRRRTPAHMKSAGKLLGTLGQAASNID